MLVHRSKAPLPLQLLLTWLLKYKPPIPQSSHTFVTPMYTSTFVLSTLPPFLLILCNNTHCTTSQYQGGYGQSCTIPGHFTKQAKIPAYHHRQTSRDTTSQHSQQLCTHCCCHQLRATWAKEVHAVPACITLPTLNVSEPGAHTSLQPCNNCTPHDANVYMMIYASHVLHNTAQHCC